MWNHVTSIRKIIFQYKRWFFFSEFRDGSSKAGIFFSWNVLVNSNRIPARAQDVVIFSFFFFLYLLINGFTLLRGTEQKVALFYLAIFSSWVFNFFLLRCRASLSWKVDCIFVVNDHFFTYQKARTHSMKCNIKCEAPTVIGNSVVNSSWSSTRSLTVYLPVWTTCLLNNFLILL